ncbi:S-adenosyl-L-methionine-dependent methyltransferase [Fusarium redolens]|uniref:S-adenosyl-L-methionine-dependent methyltransferase n=1 Tax=Fusarium redolens TaxID=48865 RepID=A0A9P9JM63_FUSRE|nr:S-adenosyl-L-methionine-dependent methyltransferase [Fusarium redolens]KAH7230082.1 S-adenosyl-L-methionine-dependent methyltransferase [Fusarium redolens]
MSAAAEVEVDDYENESRYGDEFSVVTASIDSYILRYEQKHGRTYHSYHQGSYNYPNDGQVQDRLDLVHHAFRLVLQDKLFLAPINLDSSDLRVLDIGTGTGLWAIEFADENPQATVVGVDLSPIQPGWVPPNVQFYVDDVEEDWDEPKHYDYIHCRYMAGAHDGTLEPNNALVGLMDNLKKVHDKIGRTLDPAPEFKNWVWEAGFHNITEQRFKFPVGLWPKDRRLKEIGACLSMNFTSGVDAFTAKPFRDHLGWSQKEVEVVKAEVRKAAKRREVHAMFHLVVVTAQKPGS